MTNREMSLDEAAIANGILTPIAGAQQRVAFTGTSAQSSAFTTNIITVYATQDCWIRFGSAPAAVANDGDATYLPSGFMRVYRVKIDDKLAIIRDATSGNLYIAGGA